MKTHHPETSGNSSIEPPKDRRIADLPATLRPIGEHLGYAAAVRLVDIFPGYRLHIPHHIPHDHQLRNLGDDLAHDLARVFAGETIEVPTRLISTKARQRRILELATREPPVPINEIAGEVGTTRRHVARVLSEARERGELHG